MRRNTPIFLVITLIAAIWMAGCAAPTDTTAPAYGGNTQDDDQEYNPIIVTGVNVGNEAPDFTLADSYGDSISLADFSGQPVLLFFWYEACPYCPEEYAHIQAIQEQFGDQMIVLGVNLGDSPATINAVRTQYGMTFPCLVATADMQTAYDAFTVPNAVIIDTEGLVSFNNHSAYITDLVLQEDLP